MGFDFGFEVEDTSRTSSEDISLAKPQRTVPIIRTPTHSYDFGNVDEAALPPRRRQSVPQHPTGAKLAFLFTSLVAACFLMLLNTSVVSTVRVICSCALVSHVGLTVENNRPSPRSPMSSKVSRTLAGMRAHTRWRGTKRVTTMRLIEHEEDCC
jgi:hypothetical protein